MHDNATHGNQLWQILAVDFGVNCCEWATGRPRGGTGETVASNNVHDGI